MNSKILLFNHDTYYHLFVVNNKNKFKLNSTVYNINKVISHLTF